MHDDTLALGALMNDASDEFACVATRADEVALLHFTSGTTGRPKGALHVHEAVVTHYATGLYALDLHADDVFWCTADPGWVTGMSYGVFAPLLHGVTMIVDEAVFDAERWYTILQQREVSVWYTAPTAIRMLMRAGSELARRFRFPKLRFIASVGEPLNPEGVVWGEKALGLPIHDNWWQTETGAPGGRRGRRDRHARCVARRSRQGLRDAAPGPVVIRMATGAGRQLAAQHSRSLEVWYAHVPGLKVLVPATIADARGMLWPALLDPDPVVMFEHAQLYNSEGEAGDTPVDIEHAAVRREGRDPTLVTYGGSLPRALAAAQTLSADGVEVEVIDLRVLRPLDMASVLASVRKTHRVLVVDEGWRACSLAAEVLAHIGEEAFYDLDAPLARVCSEEVPIPYAKHMTGRP